MTRRLLIVLAIAALAFAAVVGCSSDDAARRPSTPDSVIEPVASAPTTAPSPATAPTVQIDDPADFERELDEIDRILDELDAELGSE